MQNNMNLNQLANCVFLIIIVIACCGCSINQSTVTEGYHAEFPSELPRKARYALLPLLNVSQTPLAAERVETILASLLRSKGLSTLKVYPAQNSTSILAIMDEEKRYKSALEWAQQQQFDYLFTGSVEEWRYKAGLDGEPAIGITLKLLNSQGEQVLWTATGSRSGWGREAASMTAHKVLQDLLDSLTIDSND
jgi:polysaccharide biosynthesis protein PelC